MFYLTSALWGRYPALTSHHLNTPNRAMGAADCVRYSGDLFITAPPHSHTTCLDKFWKTQLKNEIHVLHDEKGSRILCNDIWLTITEWTITTATTTTTTSTIAMTTTTTTTTTTSVVKVLDGQWYMYLANEGSDWSLGRVQGSGPEGFNDPFFHTYGESSPSPS